MPPLAGMPVRIDLVHGLHDQRGPVHGGAFLRERRIALDCTPSEFSRIFVHEVSHFIWLRLGNKARRSFEEVVRREIAAGAPGELGWSAEWRKNALRPRDPGARTRRWREYCCESFCDTFSWRYSGAEDHPEFTLGRKILRGRKLWMDRVLGPGPFSI